MQQRTKSQPGAPARGALRTQRAREPAAHRAPPRPADRAPRSWAARGWSRRRSSEPLLTGELPVTLAITLARARDDLGWQRRRRRLLVPAALHQEVAHGLLVIGRRRAARFVRGRIPVPRRVGREGLADERALPVVET